MLSMDENTPDGLALPWHEVWIDAVTYPSRDTFRRILADPTAGQARAFIWMAILGVFFGIIQIVFMQIIISKATANLPLSDFSPIIICTFIGVPIASVMSLGFMAAILHGVARMLNGKGTFSSMVYCLGAIQAPVSIVSYLLALIVILFTVGSFPSPENLQSTNINSLFLPQLIFMPFSLAIGIYNIVLQVLALDAVQKFGIGKAILTAFSPYIISALLGLCWTIALPLLIFSTR